MGLTELCMALSIRATTLTAPLGTSIQNPTSTDTTVGDTAELVEMESE